MKNPTITYNDYRDVPVSSKKRNQQRKNEYPNSLFVYSLIDGQGETLYIGCSTDVEKRLRGHRQRDWFKSIKVILCEAHPANVAKEREIELIKDRQPKYNIRYRKTYKEMCRDAHTPTVTYGIEHTLSYIKSKNNAQHLIAPLKELIEFVKKAS